LSGYDQLHLFATTTDSITPHKTVATVLVGVAKQAVPVTSAVQNTAARDALSIMTFDAGVKRVGKPLGRLFSRSQIKAVV